MKGEKRASSMSTFFKTKGTQVTRGKKKKEPWKTWRGSETGKLCSLIPGRQGKRSSAQPRSQMTAGGLRSEKKGGKGRLRGRIIRGLSG